MHCPFCDSSNTFVVDSREADDGAVIRRRRQCDACGKRFTTYEKAVLTMPMIIKRNSGARVPYSSEKLRKSMMLALRKRPVRAADIEEAIKRIENQLVLYSEKEIKSSRLGQMVMEELQKLDKVGYLRFASVYLNYSKPEDFIEGMRKLGIATKED